ncbi:MAG: hypothetical protein HY057_09695 [Rhodospirillales bacterium]|nr:hypothetical protein [Rhodospirillales bacterium]
MDNIVTPGGEPAAESPRRRWRPDRVAGERDSRQIGNPPVIVLEEIDMVPGRPEHGDFGVGRFVFAAPDLIAAMAH